MKAVETPKIDFKFTDKGKEVVNRMKAVLVIDMPEHCYECPLVNYKHCNANYFVRRNHGGNIPYNFSNEYIHEQGRQTWCPLRPLPKKAEMTDDWRVADLTETESRRMARCYFKGRNEVIDEITGETDEQ